MLRREENILFLRLNCPCIHKICITKQNLCKYYDINEVSPILWEKFDFFLRNSSFAIYFFMVYTLQVEQREMRIFLQSYSIFSYNFCCIFSSFSFFEWITFRRSSGWRTLGELFIEWDDNNDDLYLVKVFITYYFFKCRLNVPKRNSNEDCIFSIIEKR